MVCGRQDNRGTPAKLSLKYRSDFVYFPKMWYPQKEVVDGCRDYFHFGTLNTILERQAMAPVHSDDVRPAYSDESSIK
jgi:hypothetical protein